MCVCVHVCMPNAGVPAVHVCVYMCVLVYAQRVGVHCVCARACVCLGVKGEA